MNQYDTGVMVNNERQANESVVIHIGQQWSMHATSIRAFVDLFVLLEILLLTASMMSGVRSKVSAACSHQDSTPYVRCKTCGDLSKLPTAGF